MAKKGKIFLLLMRKNFLVRKRHWIRSIVLQILLPIGIFLLLLIPESMSDEVTHLNLNKTYNKIVSNTEFMQELQWSPISIRYTPDNNLTKKLVESTVLNCQKYSNRYIDINGSATEDTLIAELQRDRNGIARYRRQIGIVFEKPNNNLDSKLLKYKFLIFRRMPGELFDTTENSKRSNSIFSSDPVPQIQMCLDEAYINESTRGYPLYKTNISLQQMPYPPYIVVSTGANAANVMLGPLLSFILLITLCIEIMYPANEKFIGINVLMSVNGVNNKFNLFTWLINALIFSITYLGPIIILFKYVILSTTKPFLYYSNPFLILLSLLIYLCQLINFGYHISSYFWKPIHAVIITVISLSILDIIPNFVYGYSGKRLLLYLGIIFPNFLFKKLFAEIVTQESNLIGIHWNNLFTPAISRIFPEGSFGVMMILSMLGCLFHFLMALYVHNVRPGKYGVPKNPFFCFQCTKFNKVNGADLAVNFEDYSESRKPEFENVPYGSLEPGIRIRNLKKVYTTNVIRKSQVHALRGVSIDFYKSQITALLGHNGAGKTTMMSILSGLTAATEGLVTIDGKNIQQDPEAISTNIGLCSQENMLFSNLNVHQQLMFFGVLKGQNKPTQLLNKEVDILLKKVNLLDKKESYPQQLSGGQKRRLCLAMAVIGDASVLILDEPTSGLDPESKREVWDIVLKMRGEKTIIISTHDMEEADILGDRIAIMHTGKLRCYGTSMFLKRLYGNGQMEVTLSTESTYNLNEISNVMGISVDILSQDRNKIVIAIPCGNDMPIALDKLESAKTDLGITGISVSMITLEQVFVQVTQDNSIKIVEPIMPFKQIIGLPYYIQIFVGFFIKRVIFAWKNPWTTIIGTLLPCVLFFLPILRYTASPSGPSDPISLTLRTYSRPTALIYTEIPEFGDVYKKSVQYFGGTAETIPLNTNITDALMDYAIKDRANYRNKLIISAEFRNIENTIEINGLYSGSAFFSIPITINCLSNALIKAQTADNYSIEASVQSLPEKKSSAGDFRVFDTSVSIMTFLAPALALYASIPLTELRSGFKQLQFMTGASKIMYWAAIFLFDVIQYLISIFLFISTFVIIDKSLGTMLYESYDVAIYVALFSLFGISVLPFIYTITFLKKSLTATICILTIPVIIICFVELIFMVVSQTLTDKAFINFQSFQTKFFLILPYVSFFFGHLNFNSVLHMNAECRQLVKRYADSNADIAYYISQQNMCKKSYFPSDPGTRESTIPSLETCMICLGVSSIIYFIIIFVLESKLIQKSLMKMHSKIIIDETSSGMDELVLAEKNFVDREIRRIRNKQSNQYFLNENIYLVQSLKKNYGKLEAVRGITFRVRAGECFGLLGVNGAGKSTTFKMLTGQSIPNSGTMYLHKYNITDNRDEYLQEMGYCPQQDAFIDTLNAWDHLYLFARLRGIPKSQINATVQHWIAKLNLTACAAQPSGTYSGGNKRRLNIALALIGDPTFVLMDEPTTGVDPAARRSLWNTLKTCQDAGQSIILTSHSMEECEVLCNRLVIMVRGRLVCVGASQELKQRFGAGFNINVKLIPNSSNADISNIKVKIESALVCQLITQNCGFIAYHVTDSHTTWTKMYSIMNDLKNSYNCIDDFTVLSSRLEQLFIQFARTAGDNI